MDVYGCSSSWQMNRGSNQPEAMSNWNTPLVQPSLANERVPPDGHVMPPPAIAPAPWSAAGIPWGSVAPPQLMHFTAHLPHHPIVVHCKRKPAIDEPVIPVKQFITEEKMAAHLSGLHISHEYTEHGDSAPGAGAGPNSAPEEMDVAQEWLRGARTIVLSDEIKRLQQEPLIPPSLLERSPNRRFIRARKSLRLEKPCMSLMVWKPKQELVLARGEDSNDSDDADESKEARNPSSVNHRRNGVLVAETSLMADASSMDMDW